MPVVQMFLADFYGPVNPDFGLRVAGLYGLRDFLILLLCNLQRMIQCLLLGLTFLLSTISILFFSGGYFSSVPEIVCRTLGADIRC
jgi:uncharacterized membrane protein SpoIIM required for sporulation